MQAFSSYEEICLKIEVYACPKKIPKMLSVQSVNDWYCSIGAFSFVYWSTDSSHLYRVLMCSENIDWVMDVLEKCHTEPEVRAETEPNLLPCCPVLRGSKDSPIAISSLHQLYLLAKVMKQ